MPDVADAIAAIEPAARFLGECRTHESYLEDQRALVKRDAIQRILAAGTVTSATAAEKIVETDADYMVHRATQRAAVIVMLVAEAQYEAAKLRAWSHVRPDAR